MECYSRDGDDGMHSIKGIGTMLIKIHDCMVWKINCWYVLDLQKNLISLGTLEKDGMKYYGEGY